jgi:polysaccharide deacetylase family protein (PEP-CTERM system associated)
LSEYLLSVDVEDWFQTHNLQPAVDRDSWEQRESRVVENVNRLLRLFDRYDATATFFVLGWIADHHPEVVRAIDDHGHRIACHGYNHRLLYDQSPEEVRADVERSLDAITSLTEQQPVGYRAPSFSITDWAADILSDLGFEYDSSLYRVENHGRYGSVSTDRSGGTTRLQSGLREVELPVFDLPGLTVPCAGGAYFRLLPYPIFKQIVDRASEQFVFYLHPWEIDPGQPRVSDAPLSYRLRHYTNLDKTEGRLRRLLDDFDWTAIESGLTETG